MTSLRSNFCLSDRPTLTAERDLLHVKKWLRKGNFDRLQTNVRTPPNNNNNNNNNNNKQICIRRKVVTSEALGEDSVSVNRERRESLGEEDCL